MNTRLFRSFLYFAAIWLIPTNQLFSQFELPLQDQGQKPKILRPEIRSKKKSETIREQISPDAISFEAGSCYVARLTIPRTADKESKSKCILLENGKPLSKAHALHKLIRNEGRGHYSHWTPDTLYFSTSDSSDPRTNGKKYELISQESYTEKQSSFLLTSSQTQIKYPPLPERHIQPFKIVWRNLNSQTNLTPSWKRTGAPDLSSQDAMLSSIFKPGMNEEEKALAIWKFLVDWRYHYYPAEQGDEIHDPVKFLNVYGYGFCDDCATNFAVLSRKAGIRSRTWGLSGHVVAEAFYNNQWHMFDPDHQVYYRNKLGQIAGVEELSQYPELITSKPRDPIGSSSREIANLYISTHDNRVSERRPAIKDSVLAPILEPLDQAEFRFSNSDYFHQKTNFDSAKPPVVGNGTLKRTVHQIADLKQTQPDRRRWHIKWPYVFLKGTLDLKLKSTEVRPLIFISQNTKTWQKLDGVLTENHFRISLDQWIHEQPTAVYECFIRLENPTKADPTEIIDQANAELIFQFAPRAVAHMQNTNNSFEMKLTPVPTKKGKGLEVQLFWKENE